MAKEWLDKPTFQHIQGEPRPATHTADFNAIKLRLRGLANLKYFRGIESKVLGRPVASPIGVGPLPQLSDIRMVTNVSDDAGSMTQNVCKDLKQVCCVPLQEGYTIDENDFVYIRPVAGLHVQSLNLPLNARGVVIECGYQTPSLVDAKNQFSTRFELERVSETKFRFEYITELAKTTLPVVVRGITNVEDAVKCA